MTTQYLTIEEAERCHEAATAEWRRRHPTWFENPSALLGTTFCHDSQPYGAIYFVVESAELVAVPEDQGPRYGEVPSAAYICNRASNGWWDLRGTVTRGGVRSRLLEHTGVRSLVGQQYSIQSPPDAVEKGIHVTVAM